jgi:hypothetical protein
MTFGRPGLCRHQEIQVQWVRCSFLSTVVRLTTKPVLFVMDFLSVFFFLVVIRGRIFEPCSVDLEHPTAESLQRREIKKSTVLQLGYCCFFYWFDI